MGRSSPMQERVLIVDDHQIFRQGLKFLLERQQMQVVGEAADGRAAVQLARELNPDAVIMDIGMPDMNGIEATRQLVNSNPRTKVVALSMHADRRFAGEMLKAGAKAYIVKDGAIDELTSAIREV